MEQKYEEVLERMWKKQEENMPARVPEDARDILELERMGYVARRGENVVLTDNGEKYARRLVRCHRLWEVFFHEVLGLKDFEADACFMEHGMSDEAEQALTRFLNYPAVCPDGKTIPSVARRRRIMRKKGGLDFFGLFGLRQLSEVPKGEKAKIVYIKGKDLPRLASYGIIPGKVIEVIETFPGRILKVDESEIGLDENLCAEILVAPVEKICGRCQRPRFGKRCRWRWRHGAARDDLYS
jgi:DtxR family Mn-dependent transcriptional regulator